jgi:hypothetical protein
MLVIHVSASRRPVPTTVAPHSVQFPYEDSISVYARNSLSWTSSYWRYLPQMSLASSDSHDQVTKVSGSAPRSGAFLEHLRLLIVESTSKRCGARASAVVQALCYKLEGRGLETRGGEFTYSFWRHYARGFTQPLAEMNTGNRNVMLLGSRVRPVLTFAVNKTLFTTPVNGIKYILSLR